MLQKIPNVEPSVRLQPKAESERRIDDRKAVVWRGHLRCSSHEHTCRVMDINLGGARVALDHDLDCNGEMGLHIPHIGVLKCTIAWTKNGQAGLQFSAGKPEIEFWLGQWAKRLGLN